MTNRKTGEYKNGKETRNRWTVCLRAKPAQKRKKGTETIPSN